LQSYVCGEGETGGVHDIVKVEGIVSAADFRGLEALFLIFLTLTLRSKANQVSHKSGIQLVNYHIGSNP